MQIEEESMATYHHQFIIISHILLVGKGAFKGAVLSHSLNSHVAADYDERLAQVVDDDDDEVTSGDVRGYCHFEDTRESNRMREE